MTKEELENLKLQSEIDKNKAEEEKAGLENQKVQSEIEKNNAEAAESRKRTKFRWANYIIAGVIGAAAIYSWVHSTFSDLAKERNELANVRHERLQFRSDSLLTASNELATQKADLEKQVKAIEVRLNSTEKQLQNERKVLTAQLKLAEMKYELSQEEVKSLRTKGEIIRLTAQISKLDEDIRNTKSEKEQLRTIVPAYLSLILVLDKIKVFRDGSGGAAMWRFEISANQSIPLELGERKYESPNTYDEFDINNLEFFAEEQKEFVVTVIGEREKHKAEGKMTIIWEKNRERPKAFSIDVIETPEGKKEGHFTFSFRIEKKSN